MTTVYYPADFDTEPHEIPLGVDGKGKNVLWDTSGHANLMQSNDSVCLSNTYTNIVGYCYDHPEYWNVFYAGSRAGGFRLDEETHTVLGVYGWSREELINRLYLHMQSRVSTADDSSPEVKPVMFAISNLAQLVWYLKEPELEKLKEIIIHSDKAGIHIYAGIASDDSTDFETIPAGIINALRTKEGILLLTAEPSKEDIQEKVLNSSIGSQTFMEYWPDYRFSPTRLIPERIHSSKN